MFTLNNAFVKPISTFSLVNLRFAFSPDETHFRAVGQARCARDRPHLPLLAVCVSLERVGTWLLITTEEAVQEVEHVLGDVEDGGILSD